jgi:hypothetical protein
MSPLKLQDFIHEVFIIAQFFEESSHDFAHGKKNEI